MSEEELQSDILSLAGRMGVLCYHTYDSRRSQRGWVDLVLLGSRGVLFRELKSATGKVTPDQRQWIDGLRAVGLDADVWRPADWPTRIQRELSALGRMAITKPQPTQAQLRQLLQTRAKPRHQ